MLVTKYVCGGNSDIGQHPSSTGTKQRSLSFNMFLNDLNPIGGIVIISEPFVVTYIKLQ